MTETIELMLWFPNSTFWAQVYRGVIYWVSCNALGCPETKESSVQAANAWWIKKQAEIDSAAAAVDAKKEQRDCFETGAVRDSQRSKPRYELIPVEALNRLAIRYTEGAEKYGEDNYQKGMPFGRTIGSLLRHIFSYMSGDRSEDHLAAVAWNSFTLMFYEEKILKGELPMELNDLPRAKTLDCN